MNIKQSGMRLDKILFLYHQSLHEGKLMKTPHVQQLLKINSFTAETVILYADPK